MKEHIIEYSENDNCKKCENGLEENFKNAKVTNCGCNITFKLDTAWDDDVYFYYGLSNFYQVTMCSMILCTVKKNYFVLSSVYFS